MTACSRPRAARSERYVRTVCLDEGGAHEVALAVGPKQAAEERAPTAVLEARTRETREVKLLPSPSAISID